MIEEASNANLTLALNTTLEREFVSPLTSIRGALEIIRDFPNLTTEERERFLGNALDDCARLEQGIEQLAETVYAAADRQLADQSSGDKPVAELAENPVYAERIHFMPERQIIEVDFSEFEFNSSRIVNDFYDLLDRKIEATGQQWYIVVNYHHCSIWPEAWVAFAHRGKKVNVSYSLGTVRYFDASKAETDNYLPTDPELFRSREAALASIEQLRRSKRRN